MTESPDFGNVFTTIGDPSLIDGGPLGFFSSQRCPGNLILATYDLIRGLRDRKVAVIGGFQTPMEAECLTLLLRGDQPVVVCPNRGIEGMRVPPEWKGPIDEGRLLLVSPFPRDERRKTKVLGERRNAFVVQRVSRILVTHANPGGSTERAALMAISSGKTVYTVDDRANGHLVQAGAVAMPVDGLIKTLSESAAR